MAFKFYDYYCESCDELSERMVKAEDKDNQECKTCGWIVTRQLAAPAGKGNFYHGFMGKKK